MWTVPQPVLRLVALLLLACAVGAFVLGVLGAEPRGGRLPGEAATTGVGAAPVAATEAQALTTEGPAQAPVEPTDASATAPAETEPEEPAPADPQVPALQIPDEPAPPARAPAPAPPPAKTPAPKAPATPQNGDAIGDLVDGLSDLPPF